MEPIDSKGVIVTRLEAIPPRGFQKMSPLDVQEDEHHNIDLKEVFLLFCEVRIGRPIRAHRESAIECEQSRAYPNDTRSLCPPDSSFGQGITQKFEVLRLYLYVLEGFISLIKNIYQSAIFKKIRIKP